MGLISLSMISTLDELNYQKDQVRDRVENILKVGLLKISYKTQKVVCTTYRLQYRKYKKGWFERVKLSVVGTHTRD